MVSEQSGKRNEKKAARNDSPGGSVINEVLYEYL